MERSTIPDCDVAARLHEISGIKVYAKREREALERQAAQEGGVVKGGVIIPRKH
jgi:hypothetical protein